LTLEADGAPAALDPARIQAAWVSVSVTFLVFGLTFGLWFIHIPMLAGRHALDHGILGLVLLMPGLGTLFAPPVAALIVRAVGSRVGTQIAAFVMIPWVLLPLFAPSVPVLFVAAFTFGVVAGILNVSINTQGTEVEKARGRPSLSTFHGCFSLGALVGAALWGPIFTAGLGDGRGAAILCALSLLVLLWSTRELLPDQPRPAAIARAGRSSEGLAFPGMALLGLAAIGLVCTAVEGSVGDWSGLFLTTVKNSDPALAATGLALFQLAMTLSRFAGGAVVRRLGDRRVLFYGGLLIALGMAIVILAPVALVSAGGYLLVGIGAANASPVLISAASRVPGVSPAVAVAFVSTSISTGLLAGPPVIGFVAQLIGLTAALGIVASFGLIVTVIVALRSWTPPAGTAPA
jgi:predicted MFS family arabinose efflux permease